MTPEEQVQRWVDGDSVHNDERDECCPDFSCCKPHLLQPVEVRRAFQLAGEKRRYEWLMVFLAALASDVGREDVYLAGEDRQ